MDRHGARIANILVGNDPDEALFEWTMQGPRIWFHDPCEIALSGADLDAWIGSLPIPRGRLIEVPAGSILQYRGRRSGCRGYLAIRGGLRVEPILGSRSTIDGDWASGILARPLQKGDRIELLHATEDSSSARAVLSSRFGTGLGLTAHALDRVVALRYIPSRRAQQSAQQGLLERFGGLFHVSQDMSRQGIVLDGPDVQEHELSSELTAGVAFGTIQLLPSGRPVLLGADRQPTGGYPMLGTIITVDHSAMAQLCPGDRVKLVAAGLESAIEAQRVQRCQEAQLRVARAGISPRFREWSGQAAVYNFC